MESLQALVVSSAESGDVLTALSLAALFLLLRANPLRIFAYISETKNKDIAQAKSLLESKLLSKQTSDLLREQLETRVFKKYYGIQADKSMREALVRFYSLHNNKISWHDLKRAYSFIKREGLNLTVNLKLMDHFGRWAVTVFSWFMAFYGVLVLLVTLLSRPENQTDIFANILLAIALFIMSLLYSASNFAYHSAVKVRDSLMSDTTNS